MGWMYLASIVKVIAHVQCVGIEACHGILDGIIMLIAQMSCFCSFCLLVFAANWGCLLMHEEFQDAFAGKPQRLGSQNIWLQGPHHTIHLHREGEENFSTLVERQKRLCEAEKGKLVRHDISLYWSTLEICK